MKCEAHIVWGSVSIPCNADAVWILSPGGVRICQPHCTMLDIQNNLYRATRIDSRTAEHESGCCAIDPAWEKHGCTCSAEFKRKRDANKSG